MSLKNLFFSALLFFSSPLAFAGPFDVIANQLKVGTTSVTYEAGKTYTLNDRDYVVAITASSSKEGTGAGRLTCYVVAIHVNSVGATYQDVISERICDAKGSTLPGDTLVKKSFRDDTMSTLVLKISAADKTVESLSYDQNVIFDSESVNVSAPISFEIQL